ncbi:MAG TPA: hypothetical protein VLD67_19245 [Vicinamibacterales bacterium]|nr:hypothetical protein [Vicinamibacterales bacterium]
MHQDATRRSGRTAFSRTAVLIGYLTAVALLPVAHHDIACHLKSPTHCTVCLTGSWADRSSSAAARTLVPLADAGAVCALAAGRVEGQAAPTLSGRAPPVRG